MPTISESDPDGAEARSANLIEADGLTLQDRSGNPILDRVTFNVRAGSIYCLLGPRGAGKTSLVRLFLNAARPSRGSARIAGVDVVADPIEARRRALFVLSNCNWYDTLSCRENVSLLARIGGCHASPEIVDNALRRCGVPDRVFAKRTSELSEGLRLLMWLASALVRNVNAVILDDPVASLSPRTVNEVEEALEELLRTNAAILITTADVTWASRVAHTIGVLDSGKKISEHARDEWKDSRLLDFYADVVSRVRRLPLSLDGGQGTSQ